MNVETIHYEEPSKEIVNAKDLLSVLSLLSKFLKYLPNSY